jgi:fucose permease
VNINYKLVLLIAVFFFLHVAAELSYGSLIFSYVTERDLGGESTGRLMTSMFWGALTVGRLVAVPLAIYFKPRILLLADLIGWVVSIGLLLVWTDLLAVWIASFGMGFSLASMFPMTIAFAERRIAITGRITGLFFVGGSLGSMSIPLIIGNLFESDDASSNNPVSQFIGDLLPLQGPQYMMWIMLGLGVLALAVLTALVIYSPESSRLDAETLATEA